MGQGGSLGGLMGLRKFPQPGKDARTGEMVDVCAAPPAPMVKWARWKTPQCASGPCAVQYLFGGPYAHLLLLALVQGS